MIEDAKTLVEKCLDLANHYQTLYVMGCFGAPMTEENKIRYIAHHSYNRKPAREEMIRSADAQTFGFDCVCMIKASCGAGAEKATISMAERSTFPAECRTLARIR